MVQHVNDLLAALIKLVLWVADVADVADTPEAVSVLRGVEGHDWEGAVEVGVLVGAFARFLAHLLFHETLAEYLDDDLTTVSPGLQIVNLLL